MFGTTFDDFKEYALQMPGAITIIFLLSIILPALNLFPSQITIPTLIAFTVPVVWVFLFQVITNRDMSFKKHISVMVILSYIFYIITTDFINPLFFYVNSLFFLFALMISGFVYLVYYLFFRIGKRYAQNHYRIRFLTVFVPTFILSLSVFWFLSLFVGSFMFNLAALLVV